MVRGKQSRWGRKLAGLIARQHGVEPEDITPAWVREQRRKREAPLRQEAKDFNERVDRYLQNIEVAQ